MENSEAFFSVSSGARVRAIIGGMRKFFDPTEFPYGSRVGSIMFAPREKSNRDAKFTEKEFEDLGIHDRLRSANLLN